MSMMHDIHIGRLQLAAKSRRAGYVEAVMKCGPVRMVRGEPYVRICQEDYDRLREQFNPVAPIIQGAKLKLGLGDVVAKIATPIARALKMDCIDKSTGELKPDSNCAQRKQTLNKLRVPSITGQ